jgi:hypothetical protein
LPNDAYKNAQYTWNFGDGQTGLGIITSHKYEIPCPDPKTVTLEVSYSNNKLFNSKYLTASSIICQDVKKYNLGKITSRIVDTDGIPGGDKGECKCTPYDVDVIIDCCRQKITFQFEHHLNAWGIFDWTKAKGTLYKNNIEMSSLSIIEENTKNTGLNNFDTIECEPGDEIKIIFEGWFKDKYLENKYCTKERTYIVNLF